MAPSSERKAQLSSKRVAAPKIVSSGPGQHDGGDDEDVKADPDEDLINSDLDDDDDDDDDIEVSLSHSIFMEVEACRYFSRIEPHSLHPLPLHLLTLRSYRMMDRQESSCCARTVSWGAILLPSIA